MAHKPPCFSWLTRTKLVVEYDGTDFCGWAAQAGLRTVQGTLKDAVRQVSGEDCEIVGASRTDSGAHALGQVCHFNANVVIPPENWLRALNAVLPEDLAIRQALKVGSEFNSRFCANDRWYRYRILSGSRRPLKARFAHSEWRELELAPMQEAARLLVGRHDFALFTANLDPSVENTVRELFSVEVSQMNGETRIDIVGTAFLRGMMRRISGGLMEVGLGKRAVSSIKELLAQPHNINVQLPVVLPAKGLTLMKVRYGRFPRDHRENGSDSE